MSFLKISSTRVHLPTLQEICEKVITNADPLTVNDQVCFGEQFELENGLKGVIHHREDPYQSQPLVQVRLVVKVGNNMERPDQKQLAHLLEHCLFQGADDLDWEDIKDILGKLHCAASADSNATTREFYTTYYFKNVPLASLKLCLTLLYKMVAKPTFPKERVLKEMQVVQNELLKRRSVEAKEWKFTVSHVEEGSGLIDHIDDNFSPEVIESADEVLVDKLIEFHETWYRPDNMGLIIVGNLGEHGEKNDYLEWTKGLFAQMPKTRTPLPSHPVFFTRQRQAPGFFEFTDPEKNHSTITMHLPAPEDPFASEYNKGIKWTYVRMLYHMSSVIFDHYFRPLVMSGKTPLMGVKLLYPLYLNKSKSTFIRVFALCRSEQEPEAFQDLMKGIRILAQSGVSYERLLHLAKGPSNYIEYGRKSADGMNDNVLFAEQYEQGFGESIEFLDSRRNPFLMDVLLKKILQKHPEDVNALLKHHFSYHYMCERPPVFIVSRQSTRINDNSSPKLEEIYHATGKEEIEYQQPEDFQYSLDIKEPSPCLPSFSTYIKELRTTELQYPNQSTVYLKKTLDPDRIVKLDMIFPTGSDWIMTREERTALKFVECILRETGIGNGSLGELTEALRGSGLFILLPPNLTLGYSSTTLSTDKIYGVNGIKTALQLFFSRLTDTNPIYNEHFKITFERTKTNVSKRLEKEDNTPMGQFERACSKALWNNHPMAMPFTKNEIDALTIEECRSMILNIIQRLSNPKVVLTGNYSMQDASSILAILDCYVGGLPTQKADSETPPLAELWKDLTPPDRPLKKIMAIGEKKDYVLTRLYIPIPFMGSSAREKFYVSEATKTFRQFLNANIRFKDQKNYGLQVSHVAKAIPNIHGHFKVELVTKMSDAEAIKEEVYKLLHFVMDLQSQNDKSALQASLDKSSEEVRASSDKQRYLKKESTAFWHSKFVNAIKEGGSPHDLSDEEDWRKGRSLSQDLAYLSNLLKWGENTIEMVMIPKSS